MYGDKEQTSDMCVVEAKQETLRQRLERKKAQTKSHLDSIEKAIKFIDDNPGFEAFHDLIGKVGY